MTGGEKRHGDSTAFGLMFHYFHDDGAHPAAQGTVSASLNSIAYWTGFSTRRGSYPPQSGSIKPIECNCEMATSA